jgi:hypothetical protein
LRISVEFWIEPWFEPKTNFIPSPGSKIAADKNQYMQLDAQEWQNL